MDYYYTEVLHQTIGHQPYSLPEMSNGYSRRNGGLTLSEGGYPVPALSAVSGCDVESDKPVLLGVVDNLGAWGGRRERRQRGGGRGEEERGEIMVTDDFHLDRRRDRKKDGGGRGGRSRTISDM